MVSVVSAPSSVWLWSATRVQARVPSEALIVLCTMLMPRFVSAFQLSEMRSSASAGLLLLCWGMASAFVPQPTIGARKAGLVESSRQQRLPALQVFGNLFAPATSVKTKETNVVKARALKDEILRLARGKDNGLKNTQEEKDAIVALAKDLSKLNTVKSIAKSDASEGLWRLVFTSTTGSSSGKLGPFVGEVLQDIEMDKAQYLNIVRLFGGLVEGSLLAKFEVLGANDWKVIFDNISFKVLGIPVVDKKPLNGQAGVWRMTYVDEELRVLFASGLTNSGKPARVENIYILKKQ